jgi:hypothetical protein
VSNGLVKQAISKHRARFAVAAIKVGGAGLCADQPDRYAIVAQRNRPRPKASCTNS